MRHLLRLAAVAVLLFGAPATAAEGFGSEAEAKTMLEAAIVAVQQDKDAALAAFTAGDPPFREKDLYVFCANADDGSVTAHGGRPENIGDDLRALTDSNGKAFGKEMFEVAALGGFNTVDYSYPRPGETEASPKSSFVAIANGQLCGVGYYK